MQQIPAHLHHRSGSVPGQRLRPQVPEAQQRRLVDDGFRYHCDHYITEGDSTCFLVEK